MNGSGSGSEAPPPHAQLVQMAMGHWVSRIVYVAAKLDLAGRLANGSKSADELAGPTGTDATALYRFMRSLATLGEALKADAPGAARSSLLTIASDWWFRGFGELMYSLQTSRSGFEKALGEPIFDYLGRNPADGLSSARR